MKLFVISLLTLGIIYGGVTTMAAALQLKQKNIAKKSFALMALGGVLVLSSLIIRLIGINNSISTFCALLGGLIIIHICAIVNGYMLQGKINPKHHIIRLSISIVIITVVLLG